jgi:hypothetical protein
MPIVAIIEAVIGLLAVLMVLAIPLAWSPVGRALADAIRARTNAASTRLDSRIQALEGEMHQIRELVVLGEGSRGGGPQVKSLGDPESASQPEARRQTE